MKSNRALLGLLGLTLACLLPFIAKPFHIDDPLFIWAAEQIRNHPGDFFGFQINWYHTFEPMHQVFQNPPLVCYYIAAWSAGFGWSEVSLHIAFLLPALAAVWGIYSLAALFCSRPAFAALLALLAPVFLISATSVMCDVTLLAFWIWSIRVFESGLRRQSPTWFVVAGLLAALAYLTKFSGLALVPLLLAWGLLRQRRLGWWLLTPFLVLIAAGGYEALTRHLYGHGHLFQASGYAIEQGTKPHLADRIVVGLGFGGGCFLSLLFLAPIIWTGRRAIWIGVVLFILGLIALPFEPALATVLRPKGNLDWPATLLAALLVTNGIHLLGVAVAHAVQGWRFPLPLGEGKGEGNRATFDPISTLLMLWVLGVFTFAIGVNWVVNARSFLPALPALAILAMRAIDARRSPMSVEKEKTWPLSKWKSFAVALPAAVVSLWLAWSDYAVARSQKEAAMDLMAKYSRTSAASIGPTGSVWFEGHWGWQYYMQKFGAKPLDMVHPKIQPRDLVIIPNCSYGVSRPDPNIATLLDTAHYLPNRFLSTLNPPAGACFYAATWGPLPFIADRLKPDYYIVFRHNSPP